MSAESALANVTSIYKSSTRRELVNSYDSWAKTYDMDMDFMEYNAPRFGADIIASHFSGDREAALLLDVACGTGLVAKQLSSHGFRRFVGVDGSKDMLELARLTGLYQELKQCLLGEEPLSVQWGMFDVVAIIGGLSWNHVPASVVQELYKAAKPGGYVCMTVRDTDENADFKAALERDLKQMEEDRWWTCVTMSEGKPLRRRIRAQEQDFITTDVYLYRKELIWIMSAVDKTLDNAKGNVQSALKSCTPREKVSTYDTWAASYDKDVAAVDYRAPSLAANLISSHFSGGRAAAVVLDVACGTGLVAKQLETHGFKQFVGVDGSEGMLELARKTGLYQELTQCLLGEEPLPVQQGPFDVVVIVGAMSAYTGMPISVVREMCKSAKAGGYICMTTRDACDNQQYKAALERELKQMEEEGLWTCAEVNHVENYEMGVLQQEPGYISGVVYLYKKL